MQHSPYGAVNNNHIVGIVENSEPNIFYLQQKIVETAYKGNNLILIGDAVGTGHWSVGGGMQIGAISHAEKLKQLLFELDNQVEKSTALIRYSDYVIQDSQKWGEIGIIDFYPNIAPELVREAYNHSLESWKKNKSHNPLVILEKFLHLQGLSENSFDSSHYGRDDLRR